MLDREFDCACIPTLDAERDIEFDVIDDGNVESCVGLDGVRILLSEDDDAVEDKALR